MLELAFQPDPKRREPVWRQLDRYLRELLEAGRLLPGEKLPATRELAAQLGLARNTVARAYQGLLDDGWLHAHVGQGTFVAARPPTLARVEREPASDFAWEALISRSARRGIPPIRPLASPDPQYDFRGGRVDPALLPAADIRRAWATALRDRLPHLANPFDAYGYGPLREEIALALVSRGISCAPEDVFVVSGSQHAFDLVARTFVDPDDLVAVEQPGYFGVYEAMRRAGAQLVPVRVDERGIDPSELARVLKARRVKLICVTPSAQYPTGSVLDPARRAALLSLAHTYQVPIVEDDYDAELRYAGTPLAALKASDPGGRVIYVGTFSKALFPGLRLGYVVAARSVLARLASMRVLSDFGSDAVSQVALTELLASGALERHIRRIRPVYDRRRRALLGALSSHMPEGASWTEPRAGHAVWLKLPEQVDPDALALSAARAGIAYARGESACIDHSLRGYVALGFLSQPEDKLREGVARFAELIADQLHARRTA